MAQLSNPRGAWVYPFEHVYVVGCENHRAMRWEKGTKQRTLVVGEILLERQASHLSRPDGMFSDRHGNLYIADWRNHRVERFYLC